MGSGRLLTSWKEIAAFFERDVRTVQRWEKEEGLPVHRHLHHRQSSVFAYSDELEQWWSQDAVVGGSNNARSASKLSPRVISGLIAAVVLGGGALWFGNSGGRTTTDFSSPALFPAIAIDSSRLGSWNAGVGDFNGDQRSDLVLASPDAVHLLLGDKLWQGGQFPQTVTTTIRIPNLSGNLGRGPIADYNGDGLDDLLISNSLAAKESLFHTGSSFLVFGRSQWPPEILLSDQSDVVISMDYRPDARLAPCLSPEQEADLDGDGLADILLGATEFSPEAQRSAGALFLVSGRRQWPSRIDLRPSDPWLTGSRMGEGFPGPCAVGYLDSDDHLDLAAAPSEMTLWNLLGGRGQVVTFAGPLLGVPKTSQQASAVFQGNTPSSILRRVAIADIDGDGRSDLMASWVGVDDNPQARGSIRIWFGGRDEFKGAHSVEDAHSTLRGQPGGMLGEQLLAGDLDGDEIADLVISEGGVGKVYLIWGRRGWPEVEKLEKMNPVVLLDTRPGPIGSIASADLDSDCLRELIIPLHQKFESRFEIGEQVWLVKPYRAMRVDIRPGVVPNVIGTVAGVSAVRLYGFSAAEGDQLDASTIRFGRATPIRTVTRDYDKDGFPDIQAYFDNETLKIPPGARCAAVTGRTRQGHPVGGSDSIEVQSSLPTPGKFDRGR